MTLRFKVLVGTGIALFNLQSVAMTISCEQVMAEPTLFSVPYSSGVVSAKQASRDLMALYKSIEFDIPSDLPTRGDSLRFLPTMDIGVVKDGRTVEAQQNDPSAAFYWTPSMTRYAYTSKKYDDLRSNLEAYQLGSLLLVLHQATAPKHDREAGNALIDSVLEKNEILRVSSEIYYSVRGKSSTNSRADSGSRSSYSSHPIVDAQMNKAKTITNAMTHLTVAQLTGHSKTIKDPNQWGFGVDFGGGVSYNFNPVGQMFGAGKPSGSRSGGVYSEDSTTSDPYFLELKQRGHLVSSLLFSEAPIAKLITEVGVKIKNDTASLRTEDELLGFLRHLNGNNGKEDSKLALVYLKSKVIQKKLGPHKYSEALAVDPRSEVATPFLIVGIRPGKNPSDVAQLIAWDYSSTNAAESKYLLPADANFFKSLTRVLHLDVTQASLLNR